MATKKKNTKFNKKKTIIIAIICFGLVLVGGLGAYLYHEKREAAELKSASVNIDPSRVFTKAELAKYNGQNGRPSYVAVSGKVYDVSTVYKNGKHHGHTAGQDLTDAFFSKHVEKRLAKYPLVGIYKAE